MPKFNAKVTVTPKPTVNDPQGLTIAQALRTLGFSAVSDVRSGKHIEIVLDAADRGQAEEQVREMCEKLLANPVIEHFAFEVASL